MRDDRVDVFDGHSAVFEVKDDKMVRMVVVPPGVKVDPQGMINARCYHQNITPSGLDRRIVEVKYVKDAKSIYNG